MAAHDVNQGSLVLFEKGLSFEVWQSRSGVLRLDWNRQGAVASTIQGLGLTEYGPHIIRRWEAVFRASGRITILVDCNEMLSYESGLRVAMTDWALKHRASLDPLHFLNRSKLVAMGVAVANLAVGGLITSHTTRPSYDLVVRKHGLPVNPSMPKALGAP